MAFSPVQSLSCIWLLWPHGLQAHKTSLPFTISWSLLKLISMKSMMPSNHLTFFCPLRLPPSIFPNIMVFSNESVLRIRWPEYWSFSFSICPSNDIQDWFPLGFTGLISLRSRGLSGVSSNTTVEKYLFLSAQLSLWSNSHIHTWLQKNQSFD